MIPSIEFTRNFVELNDSQHYTLSIRITSDGFCFCIFDNRHQKFIFFKNVATISLDIELIKQQINIDPIFNYPFAKIIIAYCGKHYTLLPEILFEENNKKELFGFNQPLTETEIIRYETICETEIVNIYSISENLFYFLKQKFPQAVILHQASTLINEAILSSKTQQIQSLHIDVYPDFFYATIVDNGNLILSNSFAYENTNEFIYFVISLFNRFELSLSEVNLFLSGNINKTSEEVRILRNYISHIVFEETPGYHFVPQFQEVNFHELSKLFVLCEL